MQSQSEGRRIRTRRACAIAAAVLVAGLAALHANWALGGTWATDAAPGDAALPLDSRLMTWGVVAALVVGGALVLARAGLPPRLGTPRWMTTAGCAFVALFALTMLGASIATSQSPWSLYVFLPMAVVLFGLVVVVALPA